MAIDFKKYIMSTGKHYIANSGSDENKKYHGGKAGDQTGHEAELKGWYSRPWTVVLRWPDPAVGLLIAQLGIAMCLNNKIGYDQYQRKTYWTQLEKVGYDPSKITAPCEEDCTAGVTANCKAAGYLMGIKALKNLPTSVYSGSMKGTFVRAGFLALTDKKYLNNANYLLPGDILLYEGHHAATNISYGKSVRPFKVPTLSPISEAVNVPVPAATAHVIATGDVNVRSAPGVGNRVLGVLKKGNSLPYQGEKKVVDGRTWFLVDYENENGWVSSKYSEII